MRTWTNYTATWSLSDQLSRSCNSRIWRLLNSFAGHFTFISSTVNNNFLSFACGDTKKPSTKMKNMRSVNNKSIILIYKSFLSSIHLKSWIHSLHPLSHVALTQSHSVMIRGQRLLLFISSRLNGIVEGERELQQHRKKKLAINHVNKFVFFLRFSSYSHIHVEC